MKTRTEFLTPFLPAAARLAAVTAVVFMTACAGLQPHPPAASDVTVHFVGLGGSSAFCTPEGRFSTQEFQDNGFRAIKLPAGKRITLSRHMSFAGYNVISNCAPAVGFTPMEGKHYVVNAGLVDGKCFIEMVREDANVETGVVFDTTVERPTC